MDDPIGNITRVAETRATVPFTVLPSYSSIKTHGKHVKMASQRITRAIEPYF